MSASLPALQACRDRLRQLEAEVQSERERRDALIADLVDSGTPRREIAAAGGVSSKTVCVVLKLAG